MGLSSYTMLRTLSGEASPTLSAEALAQGKKLAEALQASTARIFTPEIRKRMALAAILPKRKPIWMPFAGLWVRI